MDSPRKPLPIKEWKVLDKFFSAKKPIREGLDLELVVEKECPVFEGRQENFDGDPVVGRVQHFCRPHSGSPGCLR